mgnify:FL=1
MAKAQNRKKKKKKEKKSQDPYITPPRGGDTAYPTGIMLSNFGCPHDVITHTCFENNRLKNVGWAEG